MGARSFDISRRHFVASTGLAATAVCLVPHRLFGDEESLVVASRKAGETANITVQALRGNVSALIGSGGNIAVLPGDDGKLIRPLLFLDTVRSAARPKCSNTEIRLRPFAIALPLSKERANPLMK